MGEDLDRQARRRLDQASRRVAELHALQERLEAGGRVTQQDLDEAEARLEEARSYAAVARKRAATAHHRAAAAHESAAALSDARGDTETAERHRRAAADDAAAELLDDEPADG